ncbi:BTB domain protein, putative [Rhizoctonia solani AG-3 Rhs1AP]|uniref:BTB domain protein, putative n=2 Tax=Rhizoctonia solani AG-3 TaxID=1086053 RepID=X8JGK7_9AGAM|nr:BTB domain protein, putative [Rhizoctonia solani AG-3 Rhs1AP]KEP47331.1 putative BTB domain protein [Rhizoctonia solani 123E]
MFQVGSRTSSREPIELAETGEIVDLMLKFIYPRQSATVTSFETLDNALQAANKYQLDDMYQQLRHQLMSRESLVSVYTDSLKALGVSSTHGFKKETLVASALAHGNYDFTTVDGLLQLAKNAPEAIPWIIIIGIPSVKSKVISDVLFNYNKYPMKPPKKLCNVCRKDRAYGYLDRNSPDTHYSPPEWLARWAHGLFKTLKIRPREDWKACFDVGFLFKAVGRYGGTPIRSMNGNCTCLDSFSRREGARAFLRWSEDVYDCLAARLVGLRELEGLME